MWTGFQIGALCNPFTSGNNCGQSIEYFSVLSTTNHPSYNAESTDNDFTLVRLNGSSSITPVDIDTANLSNSYSNGKSNLWAIGLGNTSTDSDNPVYPDHVLHVELDYVTNESCCTTYDYACSQITDNMMCTSKPGKDACQGDSGGPLYDSSSQKLVGVTSWGAGKLSQH